MDNHQPETFHMLVRRRVKNASLFYIFKTVRDRERHVLLKIVTVS